MPHKMATAARVGVAGAGRRVDALTSLGGTLPAVRRCRRQGALRLQFADADRRGRCACTPGGGERSGGCQFETTTPGRPCGRKARRLTQRPTRHMNGWWAEAAACRGSGLGAGSSRRLCHAGRSRGSDAGGAKPPSGRPHGAERRGRGVRPAPRPRSAVPVAGARLGRGALPPADGGAPGGALLPRAGSCRSRPGRAAPGAAAVTVRRLPSGWRRRGSRRAAASPSGRCRCCGRGRTSGCGGGSAAGSALRAESARHRWHDTAAECLSARGSSFHANRWSGIAEQ
ncbi:uncharacterized protein LOC143693777 [Agelaius phoeniceus]|uniref:uncharacterized protein LOC143693777 n=1 Tax=Agelaius phoeniceus TaxID=39638 RepID=UPI004054CF9D